MKTYDLSGELTDDDLTIIHSALDDTETDSAKELSEKLKSSKPNNLTHDDVVEIIKALFHAINRTRNTFGTVEDILPFNVALGHVSEFPNKANK
ncbi:hypothetical protein WR164_14240 [Philodulcilactobacillus myokoensis]|uniref:Uncharacterized protein n=1 Tax=Philodulcilactobacillus myokoensis TaxID=2929573 RepID=A0A9W6B3D2_9LACO|nr:hypothetical protein [Philodulcilactobacillus myokoensis]GLB47445.1 hypothetical protein WR164_14240 [Philodulcilactobacillus myokoensis]